MGALGEAAMLYGMYTAYANTLTGDAKTEAEQNGANIDNFINNGINDAGFIAYLQNSESSAEQDLAGYKAAMDIINKAGASDPDAVAELLANGYSDPSLVAALENLLK